MTIKTYAARDSATSALRKIGVQPRDYNLFITKVGDKFECAIGAAAAHLKSLKNPRAAKPTATKPVKKAAEPKAKTKAGISATARELILAGKTNQEVWEVLKQQFNLDNSKRHYPTWYRCEMRRTGLLPKEA